MTEKPSTPIDSLNIINQPPLFKKGPDEKYYATEEGLIQAWKEMCRKKRIIDDKISPDEKGVTFPTIKLDELLARIRPDELLARIRKLAGLNPEELQALKDFLNFLRMLNS